VSRSRSVRVLVGALLALAATTAAACTSAGGPSQAKTVYVTVTPTSTSAAPTTPTTTGAPSTSRTTPKPPVKLGRPVHVSSLEGDGGLYGVGMPLVVRFSRSPTSKAAFEKAATVTVNGRPAGGAWYWEKPFADSATEVHYRPQHFWPANAKIHVALPVNKLSAGRGLSFANDLTLDYSIGAYHYSVVDAKKLKMAVYDNGKLIRNIKVSLGKASTPTTSGIKVVMERNRVEHMSGPGYSEDVPWSVRITNSGEFVHAAKWNNHIGSASTSHGCTNLSTADANWFYRFSREGDVVTYPNAPGKLMPSWDGFGDWNLSWQIWDAGGVL
jgi:lipoprotein-anchoring transpeptidase ErfK/SrfK